MSDYTQRGLVRCDADNCGWESEPNVLLADWFDENCPQCGAELLNEHDKVLILGAEALHKMGITKACDYGDRGKPGHFRVDTDRRKSR